MGLDQHFLQLGYSGASVRVIMAALCEPMQDMLPGDQVKGSHFSKIGKALDLKASPTNLSKL
jgi:hypothetical protein